MLDLALTVEDRFGIKADGDALDKLRIWLRETCGGEDEETVKKAFDSGAAALPLTVNETYFFREPAHFNLLRTMLPSCKGVLRICSAAASTGCEAYSIAMIIEDYNRGLGILPGAEHEAIRYHIDAFDINSQVIETAKKGIYGPRSLREDGRCFRHLCERWLEKQGERYRMDPSLKKHIRFFIHNIMDPLPSDSYDLIFFRNAFIYFSARSRVQVLSNLAHALADGGKLIVGVSETVGVRSPAFEEVTDSDVYYFIKKDVQTNNGALTVEMPRKPSVQKSAVYEPFIAYPVSREGAFKNPGIDAAGVGNLIACEEDAAGLARRVQNGPENVAGSESNELVAAALYLLERGNFEGAARALDLIKARDDSSFTAFLWGEYFFLQDMFTEAEFHYKIALSKNDAFWPAFYRLSSMASVEALRNYRAAQALESLNRAKDLHYEVFIGGFSPDYYRGALLKQREDVCSFQG